MIAREAAFALLAFCIVAEVGRELCFKQSAMQSNPGASGYASRLLRRPLVWGGIALWVGEALAWIAVLARLPLGLAYPVTTLTYAVVPLASMLFLGERLNRSQVAGATLVVAGVSCIAWSGA